MENDKEIVPTRRRNQKCGQGNRGRPPPAPATNQSKSMGGARQKLRTESIGDHLSGDINTRKIRENLKCVNQTRCEVHFCWNQLYQFAIVDHQLREMAPETCEKARQINRCKTVQRQGRIDLLLRKVKLGAGERRGYVFREHRRMSLERQKGGHSRQIRSIRRRRQGGGHHHEGDKKVENREDSSRATEKDKTRRRKTETGQ